MGLYCGIDLHSNNHVLTVIDEADRRVYERRLPNELAITKAALEPYRAELVAVAVESTFNWYWLVDGLMEAGYAVRLVNTAAVRQYEGLKPTDDEHDAFWLAHLMRLGILPTGYIYPKSERGLRDLARQRMRLVQHRSSLITSVQEPGVALDGRAAAQRHDQGPRQATVAGALRSRSCFERQGGPSGHRYAHGADRAAGEAHTQAR
jgi:transposase